MSTKSKASTFFLKTGEEALTLRKKLALNQSEFWRRVAIGQSSGSRYESGRKLPNPVRLLLNLAYAPEEKAHEILRQLRIGKDE